MGDLLYPSMVVNLRLRFDETFQIKGALPIPGEQGGNAEVVTVTPGAPQTQRQRRKPRRVTLELGEITVSDTANVTLEFGDITVENVGTPKNTRPLITQAGKDNLSLIANRVPKSANVELPGYRTAGKFSLEFDWRELPIDPRLIRSAGVEIYLGTVTPDNFSRGMVSVDANGLRSSILNGLPEDDMVLAGIADSWYMSHSESGSVVKIDGRDLRGLFLDSPMDPKVLNKLDLTQPINKVIEEIISKHPAGPSMKVLTHVQDWPNQRIPAPIDKEGLTRVRRSADGDGATAGASGGDDINLWDIVTKYCFLVGAIPFFRGRNIVIRPARSVYDESKPRFDPKDFPFQPNPRQDDDGRPFSERKMVFGRHIRELAFERKLSGVKVPVVEITSFDTSSTAKGGEKLLIEQWPPKDEKLARISGVLPSGEVAQTDKLKISVPGIRDRNQLLGIARNIYEEVGRGELGGSCQTSALASFKGDNNDPDLLRIRPGDQVEFIVDARTLSSKAPNVSPLTQDAQRSFTEQVAEIRQALSGKAGGGDENLARVIVASSRSAIVDLLDKFRVATVVYSWSTSSGVQVSFDFQNYFTPRYGINEQLGKNVVPVTQNSVSVATPPKEVVRPRGKVKSRRRKPQLDFGEVTVTPSRSWLDGDD